MVPPSAVYTGMEKKSDRAQEVVKKTEERSARGVLLERKLNTETAERESDHGGRGKNRRGEDRGKGFNRSTFGRSARGVQASPPKEGGGKGQWFVYC